MASENVNVFEERHYTVSELAEMWKLSTEFVRQIVRGEPGVTEWVRQQPGRRRYRVLRVPQSVAERLYQRALSRAELDQPKISLPQPRFKLRVRDRHRKRQPVGGGDVGEHDHT